MHANTNAKELRIVIMPLDKVNKKFQCKIIRHKSCRLNFYLLSYLYMRPVPNTSSPKGHTAATLSTSKFCSKRQNVAQGL